MIRVCLSIFFSVILAGLIFAGWNYLELQKTLEQPMVTVGNTSVSFEVNKGDSMKAIAEKLNTSGLYDHPEILRLAARKAGLDDQIKVGEYAINTGMTPLDFLDMITQGRVVQHRVTFVEGWTFKQMLAALAKEKSLKKELTGLSDEEIMKKLGEPNVNPEGRFFPDSYFYTSGSSDLDILKRSYEAMEKLVDELWKQRDKDLPYKSPLEAMTMASIIEKETASDDERAEIAGVFVRRLKKGMKLQTDPTVIYGIGREFDGNLTRKHLRTDTPYNTYTRTGLPPGPIAMFGRASLEAALHPKQGNTLYFVARGDGSHQFSSTLKEHNEAVRKYQLKKK